MAPLVVLLEEGPSAAEHELIERILDGIEYVALVIELLAVAIIAIGVVWATVVFLLRRYGSEGAQSSELGFRRALGTSLLVGLEVLVAADIIRTVALEPTLENVAILGLLVVIRTFLSWSLVVEIEGQWPWKTAASKAAEGGSEQA